MIVLEGLPALSPFRRDRLEARLQQVVPGLRVTGAWFVYFIQPESGATDWRITLLGYRYELHDRADDAELLAYHWHPYGRSLVVEPHLHVTNRHRSVDLSKAHLPTGIVSPTTFVRCLITEFGVEPLRPDWQDVLAEA